MHPIEDAAILMRYAGHLAQGHGVVWNVGEPPVDGVTDFLFVIVVGYVHFLGIGLEMAARAVTIGAHLITVVLIYLAIRLIHKSGILAAALSALYFALGPGLLYASVYFGTPFFILFVTLAWISALRIIHRYNSASTYFAFSICALLMGLARPEGVIVAVLMLIAVCFMLGPNERKHAFCYFLFVFLLLGGAYFIWRWYYFGYPLPNPFYKKGGGHLYLRSLLTAINYAFEFCFPIIPAFVLAFRSGRLLKLAQCYAIPIVGSTCMWILLSNEMNFAGRFQYLIYPLGLLSWYPLVASVRVDYGFPLLRDLDCRNRFVLIALAIFISSSLLLLRMQLSVVGSSYRDRNYDIAYMLSDYADKGYTMCTTEAGLLPFYSKWRSIDAWGLNDSKIAHSGIITQEYLESIKPDLIIWHGYFSPIAPLSGRTGDLGPAWNQMVEELKLYAETNAYVLAGVFGTSPYDTRYYYVAQGNSDCKEIVARIRSLRSSEVNYALLHPSP